MIKNPTPKQLATLKLNVYLKDGRQFLGCDTTAQPFGGERNNVVGFWQDEALFTVPMSEVREVVMTFEI